MSASPNCSPTSSPPPWRNKESQDHEYDNPEQRRAAAPAIAVPTITLEGDANGVPHADASAYSGKFTGKYEHRVIEGGAGHNLPQASPSLGPSGHRRRRLLTVEDHP